MSENPSPNIPQINPAIGNNLTVPTDAYYETFNTIADGDPINFFRFEKNENGYFSFNEEPPLESVHEFNA